MGNPCATDEEVLAAAKAARCDEFIRKWNMDTILWSEMQEESSLAEKDNASR